ncbi:MAG: response regulator [Deltaproteobacteria bacterium]|nr:response regulator [Deltaproteobacteria bacterium]
MRRRRLPLRLILIVPFVLQLMAAVGLTGWLAIRNSHKAVDEVSAQFRRELASRIWEFLDQTLELPHRINQLNADAIALGELDPQDPLALGRHFRRQLAEFDQVSFIFFGSPHGGAAGAGRIRDGTTVVDSTPVESGRGLVSGTRYEFASDADGNRLRQLKATPGFDARQRPWFVAATQAQGPTWTEVYPFFAEGSLAVAASRPIFAPDGRLAGVLVAEFTLAQVGDFLGHMELGQTGETFIVDRRGWLIASSTDEPPFLLGDSGQEQRRRLAVDSGEVLIRSTTRHLEALSGGLEAIDGHRQLNFEINGEAHFLHVAPLQDPRGLDWLIVVALPKADFMASIDANTRATIWLCGAAFLLALLFGVLTSRWISRPIQRLNEASQAIARGEKQPPVSVGRIRELSDLASSFDRMGDQLRASFQELETRVDLRTEELKSAVAEADAANQAKTRFLANISHEIRTPLAAILGYVELLSADRTSPEEAAGFLKTIRSNGAHLSHLLGDLLDISRIEADRLDLDVKGCELAELLADLSSAFEARAKERGLTLRIRADSFLPWSFTADPTRLRQILSNLLSNAIRYTEEGTVTLSVRSDASGPEISPEESAGSGPAETRLTFVVEDTGVGIRPVDQERLFQRFTQLEKPEGRLRGGFGLGLSITKQLTDLMQGSITVESEPGQGSRFQVQIPVESCSEWARSQLEYEAVPGYSLLAELPQVSGHILIADDSESLRQLCGQMLQRWGMSWVGVADGQAAVQRAAQEKFDIVLMDWQMPVLDGLEATRELRRLGVGTPIVALTAAAMGGDREKCLAAGCSAYLAKPIDFKELYRLLRRLLARGGTYGTQPADDHWPSREDISKYLAEDDADDAGDAELDRLRQSYLTGLPEQVATLRRALQGGEWKTFNGEIHRLVGTAGTYGLTQVFQAAAELEKVGLEQDAGSCRELLGRLVAAIDLDRGGESPGDQNRG